MKNRVNLGNDMWLVRTQCAFRDICKNYFNDSWVGKDWEEQVKYKESYPVVYPSLVILGENYNGSGYNIDIKILSINTLKEFIK